MTVLAVFPDEFPPSPTRSVSLSEAAQRCLAAKQLARRRPAYLRSLRQYWQQFMEGREFQDISRISVHEVEAWFAHRQEAPATMRSNLGRLSALFRYAQRRGWCMQNPCEAIEAPAVESKAPAILSVEQVRRAVQFTRQKMPQFLAWLTLALFAGIRPDELGRLAWSDVELQRQRVRIDAAASKVHRRRFVQLAPAPLAWLQLARQLGARLPVPKATVRRRIRRLREELELPNWPQDVLRHTAASHALATSRDPVSVAAQFGTSPRMLWRHYAELVPPEAGAAFWAILPGPDGKERSHLPHDAFCGGWAID